MFSPLRDIWKRFKQRRRLAREIDPRAIQAMCRELLEMTEQASKLWLQEPEYQAQTRHIRDEMEQLASMASRPEFKRLSAARRLELRKSLILSRKQLLEAMHNAQPPTATLQ